MDEFPFRLERTTHRTLDSVVDTVGGFTNEQLAKRVAKMLNATSPAREGYAVSHKDW